MKINLDLVQTESINDIEDEPFTDTGSSAFNLAHDFFFGDDALEIWTATGLSGTELVEDTDYTLGGVNASLTNRALEDIYTTVTIDNVTYQSGDLFITYHACADTIDAFDSFERLEFDTASDTTYVIRRSDPDIFAIDTTTAAFTDLELPDLATNLGRKIVIVNINGSNDITYQRAGSDVIGAGSATSGTVKEAATATIVALADYWDVSLDGDVILNNTHRSSDGSDHSKVGDNEGDISTNVTAIGLNTTHRSSDGSDHSIIGTNTSAIGLNTTHRGSSGTDHSNVGLNNTHRGSDGSDHSIIGTNTSAIGLNTTHRGSSGTDHSNVGLNNTHRGNNNQAHTDYLKNNANDTTSGSITAAGFVGPLTGLASSATTSAALTGAQSTAITNNTTHRGSSGTDHSNVGSNNAHRTGTGSDHSQVAGNTGNIGSNTTHRGSSGTDHSNVGLNNTHRGSVGTDHSNVGSNNSHRTGNGADHANVATNNGKVTNANHSGEVTGSAGLTIANNIIDEANLKLDEGATNDFVLTADSAKSGGMKWAAAGGADQSLNTTDAVEFTGIDLTGDNSSADTAYVPMVLYGTDDTPPAASGFPIGTMYFQYDV